MTIETWAFHSIKNVQYPFCSDRDINPESEMGKKLIKQNKDTYKKYLASCKQRKVLPNMEDWEFVEYGLR